MWDVVQDYLFNAYLLPKHCSALRSLDDAVRRSSLEQTEMVVALLKLFHQEITNYGIEMVNLTCAHIFFHLDELVMCVPYSVGTTSTDSF